MTLVDLLEVVRGRVPLSDEDVAAATGADPETVAGWVDRAGAPEGTQAMRLGELIAAVERLEVSVKAEAISDWLNRSVPFLGGDSPLVVIAAGGYERVAGIAEGLICPPFI